MVDGNGMPAVWGNYLKATLEKILVFLCLYAVPSIYVKRPNIVAAS